MTSTGLTDALPAAGGAINAAYCCNLFSNSSKQLPSIEECECEGEKSPMWAALEQGILLASNIWTLRARHPFACAGDIRFAT